MPERGREREFVVFKSTEKKKLYKRPKEENSVFNVSKRGEPVPVREGESQMPID